MHHPDDAKITPGVHTLSGSCRCGAVRYEVDLDLSLGTTQCNCTFCTKTGWWGVLTKPAHFRLRSGADRLVLAGDAQYFPRKACAGCGIMAFTEGDLEVLGGAFVSINVRCLDGVDLSGVPIHYLDGLHDTWAPLGAAPHVNPFLPAASPPTPRHSAPPAA